jgi:hypothetical protein
VQKASTRFPSDHVASGGHDCDYVSVSGRAEGVAVAAVAADVKMGFPYDEMAFPYA